MFSQLIRQIFNSFGIFFRTIRAFFTRKVSNVGAYGRRVTNVTQYASKVANGSFQGLQTAVKKPTKREDYIETKRMFISKSFLVFLGVGLVALILLIYFVIWPFLLSHFFVAKFYQEDPDLQNWSGRVIVFYDKEKTMPMYKGTLEEGVLQGKGTEYDREGLVTFEGDFENGVYCGKGTSYVGGVILYDGDFADGAYNGKGSLYDNGKLFYTGDFAAGQCEGSGTQYYSSGSRQYTGAFAAGLFEGEGIEYRQDGPMRYKGAFAAGLYEGDGTYYYSEDSFVKAAFAAGVTDGEIKWYRDGKLWYAGGARNLTPDGFGTIYAASGKAVYAGEMDRGTIDGEWLLGLTAGELREAFGEARVSETDKPKGFLIRNLTLGLTVMCSYQNGGDEPSAYKAWLRPEGVDKTLLPWQNSNELTQWAMAGENPPEVSGVLGPASGPDGALSGQWSQTKFAWPETFAIMLWQDENGTPVQMTWGKRGAISTSVGGGIGSGDGAAADAQARLDEVMEALDAVTGGEASPESAAAVSGMLGEAESAEEVTALMDALTDCYTYTGMVSALESGKVLLEQQLQSAEAALKRGTGSQAQVDEMRQKLDDLGRTLAQYQTGAKQAQITAQYYCGKEPDPAALQSALVVFDPTRLKPAALCDGAVKYATEVSAGRYEVDTGALTMKVKKTLLDLNVAYENVTAARGKVEQAAKAVSAQSAAFAKGTADESALFSAQLAQTTAVADLCQAMGSFTHTATALNDLTGGMVSTEQKWMADAFAGVYAAEIQRAKEEAAEVPVQDGSETGGNPETQPADAGTKG